MTLGETGNDVGSLDGYIGDQRYAVVLKLPDGDLFPDLDRLAEFPAASAG